MVSNVLLQLLSVKARKAEDSVRKKSKRQSYDRVLVVVLCSFCIEGVTGYWPLLFCSQAILEGEERRRSGMGY